MTTNRNKLKQFFVTFPKSNISKQEFLTSLQRFNLEYYKVAQELHADGTPHLHAVIKTAGLGYTMSFMLRYLKNKYPDDYKRIDVQPVKQFTNAIAYLDKEDTETLCSGPYVSAVARAAKQRKLKQHILAFRQLGIEYDTEYVANLLANAVGSTD